MTTIAKKITELNNIKTNIKKAIKSKGVKVEDYTPFNQYPSKIGQIVHSHSLFNSNTYACSIDGSEIDTEAKRNAVIMQHRDNAIAAGKTEIFFVFKGDIPSNIFNGGFDSIFHDLYSIQKVSSIFDSQANIPATLDGNHLFAVGKALTTIPRLDTSNVTDMNYAFYYCNSLTSIPRLDTSNVTDMSGMFSVCESLTTIPALDTSNVTDMSGMFFGCISLKNIDMFGMNITFSVAGTKLGTEALNKLFTNLATVTIGESIDITGTPGAATCDRSIATSKGWIVVG